MSRIFYWFYFPSNILFEARYWQIGAGFYVFVGCMKFELFYPMDNFNRGRLSVLDAYPALFLFIFDAVHCDFIHYNI